MSDQHEWVPEGARPHPTDEEIDIIQAWIHADWDDDLLARVKAAERDLIEVFREAIGGDLDPRYFGIVYSLAIGGQHAVAGLYAEGGITVPEVVECARHLIQRYIEKGREEMWLREHGN